MDPNSTQHFLEKRERRQNIEVKGNAKLQTDVRHFQRINLKSDLLNKAVGRSFKKRDVVFGKGIGKFSS